MQDNEEKAKSLPELTDREQDVCKLLLDGKSLKEISGILNLSYHTANFHKKNLYQKFDVHNFNEFYRKYTLACGDIPKPQVLEFPHKKAFQPRFIILTAIIVAVVISVLIWNSARKTEIEAVFDFWFALGDNASETIVTRRTEEINGAPKTTVTISGTLNDSNVSVSGVYGRPNAETHQAKRSMKAISFFVLGDGNRYFIALPTQETTTFAHHDIRNIGRDEVFGDHWLYIFPTTAGEVSSITINIPDDLIRVTDSEEIEFVQENILYLQIQPIDPGDYRLKFWDIRLLR